MTNVKNIAIIALLVTTMVLGVLFWTQPNISFGSVSQASEYYATTTAGMADGHNVVAGNKIVTLGSVVMTNPSAATSTVIWNATSTTDIASTTFATIPAGASAGTYTFDVVLTRGIVVDTGVGNTGEAVITYRP